VQASKAVLTALKEQRLIAAIRAEKDRAGALELQV